jgi:hypothetical protein
MGVTRFELFLFKYSPIENRETSAPCTPLSTIPATTREPTRQNAQDVGRILNDSGADLPKRPATCCIHYPVVPAILPVSAGQSTTPGERSFPGAEAPRPPPDPLRAPGEPLTESPSARFVPFAPVCVKGVRQLSSGPLSSIDPLPSKKMRAQHHRGLTDTSYVLGLPYDNPHHHYSLPRNVSSTSVR